MSIFHIAFINVRYDRSTKTNAICFKPDKIDFDTLCMRSECDSFLAMLFRSVEMKLVHLGHNSIHFPLHIIAPNASLYRAICFLARGRFVLNK